MGYKLEIWQAIALAPVVTVLILWVVKSIRRLPSDVKGYFQAVLIWVRG